MTKIKKKPTMVAPSFSIMSQPQQSQQYDFSKHHIHIMMPCYGGMVSEATMTSLVKFILAAQQLNLHWSLDTMTNESLVTRARNNLCGKAMSNEQSTHFMFIDADIRFEPIHILGMVAAEKDVIGGLYPKKTLPVDYVVNIKVGGKTEGPFFEVDTIGTGFLLFRRSVYEKLIAAYSDEKYKDDVGLGKQFEPNLYNIFDTAIDSNQHLLSEDWTFCRRWAELGGEIWADARVILNHIGTYEFRGDVEALQRKGIKIMENK